MKKVLIVADLFQASPRIPGLAKYLPEFGWQPILLTTPLGEDPDSRFGPPNDFREKNRVIETFGYVSRRDVALRTKERLNLASKRSYQYFRPIFRALYRRYLETVNYPDAEKRWKPFAVDSGEDLLKEETVDAMISSYSPATAHLIAHELKDKHGFPWAADFRDLWTQNHNYSYSYVRKIFEKRLEVRTLSTADALVTTSKPWAEKLKTLHKKRVCSIPNGYDPEILGTGKANLTSNFTITYAGQIYREKQDPSKLLAALRHLIDEKALDPKMVEVRFYGLFSQKLHEKTEEYGLSGVVKQYGVVSRQASFERQRESQVLLLLNWDDPDEKGVYTGKIFEYLAARRPMLATGGFGNDVVEELLRNTNSGVYCPTVENIEDALESLYNGFRTRGKVVYDGNIEEVYKYSYREMARKFAEILENLIKGGD